MRPAAVADVTRWQTFKF